MTQPAAAPKTRVSADERQDALKAWLINGLSSGAIVDLAKKTWPIRAGRVRADIQAIDAEWAAEDDLADEAAYLRVAKRQRDELLFRVMRRLDEAADLKELQRQAALCDRLMRQRDQIAFRLFDLQAEKFEPKAPAAAAPETVGPVAFAAPPAAPAPSADPVPAATPGPATLGPAKPVTHMDVIAAAPEKYSIAEMIASLNQEKARQDAKYPWAANGDGPFPPSNGRSSPRKQARRKGSASTPAYDPIQMALEAELMAMPKDTAYCPLSIVGNGSGKPQAAAVQSK